MPPPLADASRSHLRAVPHQHFSYRCSPRRRLSSNETVAAILQDAWEKQYSSPPPFYLGHIGKQFLLLLLLISLSRGLVPSVFGARTEHCPLPYHPSSLTQTSLPLSSTKSKNTYNLCKFLLLRSIHGFTDSPELQQSRYPLHAHSFLRFLLWFYILVSLSHLLPFPLSSVFVKHDISRWGLASISCFL